MYYAAEVSAQNFDTFLKKYFSPSDEIVTKHEEYPYALKIVRDLEWQVPVLMNKIDLKVSNRGEVRSVFGFYNKKFTLQFANGRCCYNVFDEQENYIEGGFFEGYTIPDILVNLIRFRSYYYQNRGV